MATAQVKCDLIVGMKALCEVLNVSEATVLKWHRELGLPIKKGSKNGDAGVWIGSLSKINVWVQEYVG